MAEKKKRLGYCTMCMQNVEHTRILSTFWGRLLDVLTLGVLRLFRIGPYYCFQCEQKTIRLRHVSRSAPTFDSQSSAVAFRNSKRRPAESPAGKKIADDPLSTVADSATIAEPVGNYLKQDQSLLMRDQRLRKYSANFRDAAVMKLLKGTASLSDLRQELGVTDNDLIHWTADLFQRKQVQIDELQSAIDKFKKQFPEIAPIVLSINQELDLSGGKPIVEGRVVEQ